MSKIAIIGASYLQLPLVLKVISLKHEAICFSWEKDAVAKDYCTRFYPISIVEKEAILKVCKKEGIDGVLTIASDIAVTTVSYIADALKLTANSIESAFISTNKYAMKEAFKSRKVNIPAFFEIKNSDYIWNNELNFPVIIKPTDSSGSKGVSIVNNELGLKDKIKKAFKFSLSKQVIIEEFIEGKEISVETISNKGKHFILNYTDKVTSGKPNFVELEHHQPYNMNELNEKINSVTITALDSLGIKFGASHVELLISPENEVFVVEVGARMGGDFIGSHLVYLSTGYDYLKGVIEVSMGKFSNPIIKSPKTYSGVFFLSSQTEWVEKMIEKHEEITYEFEFKDLKVYPNKLENSTDRYGYFIYQTDHIDLVEKIKKKSL